jgi:hypothetical protein
MTSPLLPSSTPPPTHLSIGEVVFFKIGTANKSYLKQIFRTNKHLTPKQILKQFTITERIAKDIKHNIFFYVDPNILGYVNSELISCEEANQMKLKFNGLSNGQDYGYSIKLEVLNKNMLSCSKDIFCYSHSLLSISDIVIYEPHELYEEIMNEKGNG